MIDGLTGIYNRRYFENAIERAWGIARRERLPLALMMIDVDDFKNFNDTYGHLAGDQCLISIANEIKKSVHRAGDFAARFGGEEFVVLLFNTTEEGAAIIAEDIAEKIQKLRIQYQGVDLNVTVSMGVAAAIPRRGSHPKDLLSAADEALYQAKKAGRNTVVRASG